MWCRGLWAGIFSLSQQLFALTENRIYASARITLRMQFLKIVALCIVAAIVYGMIHDQVTAHLCVEYFSVFHPPVFATNSPTLLALGWGVIATWWVGLFLGVLLAIAARVGSRPKLAAADLAKPIVILLLVMAASAIVCGFAGYAMAKQGMIFPPAWVAARLNPSAHARFMADWWAHSASYAVGLIGGLIVCVLQYRKRGDGRLVQSDFKPRTSSL